MSTGNVEKMRDYVYRQYEVEEGTAAGPGILITGHDLLDLHDLLKQCEGTDVKVYTHGEMLPAHMYPELRKHPNLAGNNGGAWQKQRDEFEAFGGAILATTGGPTWLSAVLFIVGIYLAVRSGA